MTVSMLGEVRREGDRGTIHMEDVYDTDIDDLWGAVSEPERLSRWLATVEGELRVGGRIHATFTSSWDGPGRIEVCDAPQRLLLTMQPGTPEETELEAVLTAEGQGTRLVIEERGLPWDEAPAYGAGWQAHLDDLRAHLEGRPTGDWHTRWTELIPSYRPERRP